MLLSFLLLKEDTQHRCGQQQLLAASVQPLTPLEDLFNWPGKPTDLTNHGPLDSFNGSDHVFEDNLEEYKAQSCVISLPLFFIYFENKEEGVFSCL